MLTSAYTQAHREAAKEWVLTWSMAVYRAQSHGNVLPPPFNGLMIILQITGASFEMRQRVQLIVSMIFVYAPLLVVWFTLSWLPRFIFSAIFTGGSSSLMLSREGWHTWYSDNLDPVRSESNLRIGKILATNDSDDEQAEQGRELTRPGRVL